MDGIPDVRKATAYFPGFPDKIIEITDKNVFNKIPPISTALLKGTLVYQ